MEIDERVFRPLDSDKLSGKAISQIEGLINSGALKPGDKLPPERELATQLRLSRSILREALKTLEGLGYIYRKPGGGTFVRDVANWNSGLYLSDLIKRATFMDYLEAREMLEQKVVELVIERATDEELDEVEGIVDLLEKSDLSTELVLQFHHRMASLTRNIVLVKFMLTNWELHKNLVMTNNVNFDEGRRQTVLAEHSAILSAVRQRNVKKAQQAVLDHLNGVRKNLGALLAAPA